MKLKTKGVILALKNVGGYLTSFTVAGIKADPSQFAYSLLIYLLVTTPSDLFLLNHWTEKK